MLVGISEPGYITDVLDYRLTALKLTQLVHEKGYIIIKYDNESNTLYFAWCSAYDVGCLRNLKESFNLVRKLKQNEDSHIPQEPFSSATLLEAK